LRLKPLAIGLNKKQQNCGKLGSIRRVFDRTAFYVGKKAGFGAAAFNEVNFDSKLTG
jgi:hypothetical protein